MGPQLSRGLVLVALSGLLLSGGCGVRPQPSSAPQFFAQAKDDLGRTVSLSRPPRRIVCLAPNVTEIAFALGLGNQIVGVSQFSDFPPQARQKPQVGRYDRPSLEKIVSFHPDLVLLGYGNPRELFASLEKAGIPAFGSNPKSIEGIFRGIEDIANLAGVPARGQRLTTALRDRLARIKQKLASRTTRPPRVFIMVDEEPLWTAGRDTLQDEILRLAGGENIATRPSYYPLSKETLFASKPDLILIATKPSQADAVIRRIRSRGDIGSLGAVKKGKVAVIDADIFTRPGPRVVEAVEQLHARLAPK